MGLRELNLKPVYYSDEDDLLQDFYIPALSQSVQYDRIAGYFSSNSLAVAARGMANLVANGGKMRLITNVILSMDDQEAIKRALREKEDEILSEIENLEDELKRDHLRIFAWMLKKGLLEIKIAVVRHGIEHQKIGALKDADGQIIVFSGSDNETVHGWLFNDEQFHVFCGWKAGDLDHLRPDVRRFECLWNDTGRDVRVYEVSEAFRRGFVRDAPRDNDEFAELSSRVLEALAFQRPVSDNSRACTRQVKLRDIQEKAIEKWFGHDGKCIFEMATGTGKTYAALGCLERLLSQENRLTAVISCPGSHMVSQWRTDLSTYGFRAGVIVADSTNPNWRDELGDAVRCMNSKAGKLLIVLTTHDTFCARDFLEILQWANTSLFLIADEVHGMWTTERKRGFISRYAFRLGLSATPSRWFDSEGTRELLEYLNCYSEDDPYKFTLEQAINTINPDTGETYLSPYVYRPYFAELTSEELAEYEEKTAKIARAYYSAAKNTEKQKYFNLLCMERAEIVRNASAKYEAFREILSDILDLSHCLVFCSPEQIGTVQEILLDRNIIQHKFTQSEGTKRDPRYSGHSERDALLEGLSDGTYQALVAIRCLDEGVDIPQAHTGIILASTGNPRQYIQRRGRLLRRYPGKDKATIYDVIVVPPAVTIFSPPLGELERKILRSELQRYDEFSQIAMNPVECISKIREVENRLKI